MDKLIGQYRFNMNHQIGRGSYGIVYKGKSNGMPVAIKVIDKRILNQENIKQLLNEIDSMRNLNHVNVVQFLDYYETPNNIYIIQEYCDGGDLRDFIKKGKSDCNTVIQILRQILNGYYELYQKQIIHRDIKPANILVNKTTIKLADFGFAKKIDFENDLMHSVAGTPLYMAPQVILRQPYTAKCDIWSIGMILFELLYQKPPIKATNLLELQEQIKNPITVPQMENEQLQEIIQRCLQVGEEKRISWEELYSHPIYQPANSPQEDYYMKQIEHYGNPQEEEVVCDYRKLMIQNYLQIEFQSNYKIMMTNLEFIRSLFNFSVFIKAQQQQIKHEVVVKLYQLLRNYAANKLEQIENPVFLKEYDKFIKSEIGLYCLAQSQAFKQNYLEKQQEFINSNFDANELIQTLEYSCEQLQLNQLTQMTHQKLCFILMSKLIIAIIKLQRQYGPTVEFQVIDIQQIEMLQDQDLMLKISQI